MTLIEKYGSIADMQQAWTCAPMMRTTATMQMTREQRRRAMIRAYAEGEEVASIAKRFDVTSSAVVVCARRAGIPARRTGSSEAMKKTLADGHVRPRVRSAQKKSVAKSYVHPAITAKESYLIEEMRADPEYVEVAPRHFVSAENFRRYKDDALWTDIRGSG